MTSEPGADARAMQEESRQTWTTASVTNTGPIAAAFDLFPETTAPQTASGSDAPQAALAPEDEAALLAAPVRPARDSVTAEPEATYAGVWAPDASSCSIENFRQGLLPTIINAEGAWAGEAFCLFKNPKQTKAGWLVVASCSSGVDQWTTQVRLSVKGRQLTWESKRGRQVYTRCSPDLRMAEAH